MNVFFILLTANLQLISDFQNIFFVNFSLFIPFSCRLNAPQKKLR